MWRRNWEHLTPFFAYPADIRKVIYTTNAVESLNMSPGRLVHHARRTVLRLATSAQRILEWLEAARLLPVAG
jgi:transposase-like protein